MRYRNFNPDLVSTQENLRIFLLRHFYDIDFYNLSELLAQEDLVKSGLDKLIVATKGTHDERFFKYYSSYVSSLFQLLRSIDNELKAEDNSKNLKAAIAHINQIDFEYFNKIPDFKDSLFEACESIRQVSSSEDIKKIIKDFISLPFPTIFTFAVEQFQGLRENFTNESTQEEEIKVIVLSLQLTIDGEPWANPQILKPEELYTIKGKVSLNEWPDGFDKLILRPVSTSSNDWFSLSIPEIKRETSKDYNISGQVVFKYPQSTFESLISIRMFGYFQNSLGETHYPTIIGYDQLILKVLDQNSSYFMTGFRKMNKKVLDIANTISKELPNIDKDEKENFLRLLSGILNYHGFCMQQGVYKGKDKVSEDEFRDNLIQHLIGLPYLGEDITKEAHLAGGRIEIGYKGIIAELKVEDKIYDRDKLYENYGKQPIAYASGNSMQLSILCILDLTEKILPPSVPQNNICVFTPKTHGFGDKEVEHQSKLVMVVIDGNTKKPSAYSK